MQCKVGRGVNLLQEIWKAPCKGLGSFLQETAARGLEEEAQQQGAQRACCEERAAKRGARGGRLGGVGLVVQRKQSN